MKEVGCAVTPEPVGTRTKGPRASDSGTDIEIGGGVAEIQATLSRRSAILHPALGQQRARHQVLPAEFVALTEGAVGHEIHRVLAIEHWQLHGVASVGAHAVHPD